MLCSINWSCLIFAGLLCLFFQFHSTAVLCVLCLHLALHCGKYFHIHSKDCSKAYLICFCSLRDHGPLQPVVQCLKTVVLCIFSDFLVVDRWRASLLQGISLWPDTEMPHVTFIIEWVVFPCYSLVSRLPNWYSLFLECHTSELYFLINAWTIINQFLLCMC